MLLSLEHYLHPIIIYINWLEVKGKVLGVYNLYTDFFLSVYIPLSLKYLLMPAGLNKNHLLTSVYFMSEPKL